MLTFIKVNASDITPADLKALMLSQQQLSALTELVESARLNKSELGGESYRDRYFAEVKRIIS